MLKTDKLSMRQEAFALNVASGQALVSAYLNAGYVASGTPPTSMRANW